MSDENQGQFWPGPKEPIYPNDCATCGHHYTEHNTKMGCMVTYKSGMENCECVKYEPKQ